MKTLLLLFFVTSITVYVDFGNAFRIPIVDDAIYKAIHGLLLVDNPDKPELVKCIVDDFKGNKIADKFYTPDLLINTAKLKEEINPYLEVAQVKCNIALFIQSPLGIFALIAVLLLLILSCCCVIKCIFC